MTEAAYYNVQEEERGTSMASRLWDRIRSYNPTWGYGDEEDGGSEDEPMSYDAPMAPPHHTTAKGSQREIVIRFPSSYEDATDLAESLKRRQPVIVNLEKADNFEARRIVDFLSGVTFAFDGHMSRIGEGIFVFTPRALPINSEDRSFLQSTVSAYGRPTDRKY